MPTIKTTLSITLTETAKKELASRMIRAAAAILQKPENVHQVIIDDGKTIVFGTAPGESAFIAVMAIGEISSEKGNAITKEFCTMLEELGIPGKRVYICFNSKKASDFGCDSALFG